VRKIVALTVDGINYLSISGGESTSNIRKFLPFLFETKIVNTEMSRVKKVLFGFEVISSFTNYLLFEMDPKDFIKECLSEKIIGEIRMNLTFHS
jgi:hypothetical protein